MGVWRRRRRRRKEEEEQRWIKDERGENDRIGDNSAGIGRN